MKKSVLMGVTVIVIALSSACKSQQEASMTLSLPATQRINEINQFQRELAEADSSNRAAKFDSIEEVRMQKRQEKIEKRTPR